MSAAERAPSTIRSGRHHDGDGSARAVEVREPLVRRSFQPGRLMGCLRYRWGTGRSVVHPGSFRRVSDARRRHHDDGNVDCDPLSTGSRAIATSIRRTRQARTDQDGFSSVGLPEPPRNGDSVCGDRRGWRRRYYAAARRDSARALIHDPNAAPGRDQLDRHRGTGSGCRR